MKGIKYTLVGEDFVAFFYVVCCAVMLGPVVCFVGGSGAPEKKRNWFWVSRHCSQSKRMSMALDHLG
jgi:hypothetical protein